MTAPGQRAAPGHADHLGMPSFPAAAAVAVADQPRPRHPHHPGQARRCRRRTIRLGAAPRPRKAIKDHTLANLDTYLLRLEENVTGAGGHVHWAQDATEANAIVAGLVRAAGTDRVVKVKSMATQEIGLNEALAAEGIAVLETDLAELIVQLGHDRPSHILVPAIHKNRAEIREIFLREMPDAPAGLTDDPRGAGRRGAGAPAPGVPVRAGGHVRAPTSPSPRPARWWWSSPRATAGCA